MIATCTGNLCKRIFILFLFSLVVIIFCMRATGPKQPFIGGDGLGYYAYLPATFIYNDHHYSFSWFNDVHDRHYNYSLFQPPEDNFMAPYKNKRVNKYYQGLSFTWLPFFGIAHLAALISDYPADGFSRPYQHAIAFASLFYLVLGLIFLRKLLLSLFCNEWIALLVSAGIGFGTALFAFGFNNPSHSHLYSFTFNVMFLHYLNATFNNGRYRLRSLLLCGLTLLITVSIRPFNIVMLLAIPAFISATTLPAFKMPKFHLRDWLIVIVMLLLIFYVNAINWQQTGTLLPYTYTGERFYFDRPHFLDALFSYHMGLFTYTPLLLFSIVAVFINRKPRFVLMLLFFLALVYVYSCWWFWPVVQRGMIDFYAIPAILIGAFFSRMWQSRYKVPFIVLAALCVLWYQFKYYQIRIGALDLWLTSKEIFWQNFFRTDRAYLYPVPPSSVIKQKVCAENFDGDFEGVRSSMQRYSGAYALAFDSSNAIRAVTECKYPEFMQEEGIKNIKLKMYCFFTPGIGDVHLFLRFMDRNGDLLKEQPFYIHSEQVRTGSWDMMEYGIEVSRDEKDAGKTIDRVQLIVWNTEARKPLFIDNVEIGFYLRDESFETER